MATIKIFPVNHFSENTYIIYDDTKECVIIDPGCYFDDEKKTILSFIEENNLILKKVLYTHCHLDHFFGAKFIKKNFETVPFAAHKTESVFIENAHDHANRFRITIEQPPALDVFIEDGDIIKFGNTELKAIWVPGHSPGSICYYNAEDNFLICGDVLFNGSIGRTDLQGGDYDLLIKGIKTKLLTLPDSCVCYSGHGPNTTIGNEKKSNPFLG